MYIIEKMSWAGILSKPSLCENQMKNLAEPKEIFTAQMPFDATNYQEESGINIAKNEPHSTQS